MPDGSSPLIPARSRPGVITLDRQRFEETAELGRGLIARLPGAGLLILDANLHVLLVEGDAHRNLAYESVVGRPVRDVIPAPAWAVLKPRYALALAGEVQSFDYEAITDASVHSLRLAPIRDGAEVVGVLVLSQEITAAVTASRRLEGSERLQRSVLEALEEGVIVLDRQGRLLQANAAACQILGTDLTSARPDVAWWEAFGARRTCDGSHLALGAEVIGTGRRLLGVDVDAEKPDGTEISLSVNYQPVRDSSGAVEGLVLSFRDVTGSRREARNLVESQERLRDAHEVARMASWEWQPATDEVLIFTALPEDGAAAGSRAALDDLLGAMSPEAQLEAREDIASIVRGEIDETTRRHCQVYPEVGPVWMETRSRAVRDPDGTLLCVRGTSQDVTEQELAKQQAAGARDYLRAVADSMGEGLVTLDVEGRVAYMNDAAESLFGWPRAELQGRVLHDAVHTHEASGPVTELTDCPIVLARRESRRVRVEDDLFLCRDGSVIPVAYTAAPFETDDGVEGCVVVFENISDRKARETTLRIEADKLKWIERVRDALAEDRFVLYAQPIVDVASGKTVQRELLLRMRDPEGNIVAPGSYLQTAEQYGFIADIDRWVIERGVELAATGQAVQMNISAHSVGNRDVPDHIESCIRECGADPALIVFEITETALIEDEQAARAFSERLHNLGCKLALDDFGTGFGGFTYLKHLPVDYLKIDIEFVRDLATNPASRHVVQAVVALARGFELQTVAEGVEDAEILSLLLELGVDFAQGYHIARPGPIPAVVAPLNAGPRVLSAAQPPAL